MTTRSDTIRYPLSAVAEQCPTCGIWTADAATCTNCDRVWAERSRAILTERLAALEAAHPTAWLRSLLANLAIAGGLQLMWRTEWYEWTPERSEPHPRFRG